MAKTTHRRSGLAIVVAASCIVLAACSGPSSPHVASLGKSASVGGAGTTTVPASTATQSLDKWAACMRSHGDPNQADPTVDVNKVIQITLPVGYAHGVSGGGPSCSAYLTAAETALRGGQPPEAPDQAVALKFAQCMRANGIPDYPDPSGNSNGQSSVVHVSAGSDLNPANPTFQAASTLCANKTGFQKFSESGTPQPGTINLNMAGGFGGKPGGNGGAAANPGPGGSNG
jgi:hypothetical protein